jgi:hypothetical protein
MKRMSAAFFFEYLLMFLVNSTCGLSLKTKEMTRAERSAGQLLTGMCVRLQKEHNAWNLLLFLPFTLSLA